MSQTFKILISGRVQGVGFRPYVFSLAKKYEFKGEVFNDQNGVVIYLNGNQIKVENFINQLQQSPPKLAIIENLEKVEVEPKIFKSFKIRKSHKNTNLNLPLTPDFGICEDCKNDIQDKENRRYGYAFTTCVNCGPRYSIITNFPFERDNTSIVKFEMCNACLEEYENPDNRRFHSQTNSCAKCGISLKLTDNYGNKFELADTEILEKAAEFISEGKIVAVKNSNGYLLCCDANNSETIKLLRARKKRPTKPFAIMCPSIEYVEKHLEINSNEKAEFESEISPIVIIEARDFRNKILYEEIAPGLNDIGIMVPNSALMFLLLKEIGKPIVATSGNIHGSPIIATEEEAETALRNVADYFLHNNLSIEFPQDDSVIKWAGNDRIILRRSRGMAPTFLEFKLKTDKKVLAMGAHLKSTFSFRPNDYCYLSQYFGNLDSYEVNLRYRNVLEKYLKMFTSKPEIILVDKHFQYESSILGKELSKRFDSKLIEVQHHKAHFAGVLGEHHLFDVDEKILGVIWDGTGLGDDGNIWGGEFFIYQNKEMERIAHFEYFDWIAGDKMAEEPRLTLLSILNEKDRNLIKDKFNGEEWKIYNRLLKHNKLKTSSVGRLFDAAASALNIKDFNTYEGEAAMLLESLAKKYAGEDFLVFFDDKNTEVISPQNLINQIIKALEKGTEKAKIAASLIDSLARIIISVSKKNKCNIIACSGGVFQNSLLVLRLQALTENTGLILKINRKLSSNDENISFGQLMYFLNGKEKREAPLSSGHFPEGERL